LGIDDQWRAGDLSIPDFARAKARSINAARPFVLKTQLRAINGAPRTRGDQRRLRRAFEIHWRPKQMRSQMSNELITSENTNLPVQYDSNVEELAAEAANDLGTLLKFAKGVWTLGEKLASPDAEFITAPEAVVQGWIRFDDKKVVERILKRPGDKRRLPDRDELSMSETFEWPVDAKGVARDPWIRQVYLPMLDDRGGLVTFVTGSVGGRIAVGKICSAFLKNNKARPIVKLSVGSFRSKDYGNIPAPAFEIVGFEGVDTLPENDSGGGDRYTTGLAAELNDSLPSFAA
jgi:hypothetical protein